MGEDTTMLFVAIRRLVLDCIINVPYLEAVIPSLFCFVRFFK